MEVANHITPPATLFPLAHFITTLLEGGPKQKSNTRSLLCTPTQFTDMTAEEFDFFLGVDANQAFPDMPVIKADNTLNATSGALRALLGHLSVPWPYIASMTGGRSGCRLMGGSRVQNHGASGGRSPQSPSYRGRQAARHHMVTTRRHVEPMGPMRAPWASNG